MLEKIQHYFESDKKYKINRILSAVTLLLVLWLASGTLTPYNLTAPLPLTMNHCATVNKAVDKYTGQPFDVGSPGVECRSECLYVADLDHEHFLATFLMLDGADKSSFNFSVALRRILFPVLAYPFMKLMGYEVGGILTSFVLHLIVFLVFISFIRREIGEKAAIFAMWAVATFPGITFFGGMPYSYAIIFPCFMIVAILMWHLAKAENLKKVFLLSLGLGIAFLGYDLLPTFGLGALLLMLRRKMYLGAIITLAGIMIPNTLTGFVLKYYYGADALNANIAVYGFITFSYFGLVQGFISNLVGIDPNSSIGAFLNKNAPFPDLGQWFEIVKFFPLHLLFNFFYSAFLYFPIFFILLRFSKLFGERLKLNSMETAVILALFILFIFNNLAPPYRSWQMRGFGYVRIYESLSIILILYIARKIQTLGDLPTLKQRLLLGAASLFIALNFITSVSTFFPNSLGLWVYSSFTLYDSKYGKIISDTTGTIDGFKANISRYGRYPIGVCAPLPQGTEIMPVNPESK